MFKKHTSIIWPLYVLYPGYINLMGIINCTLDGGENNGGGNRSAHFTHFRSRTLFPLFQISLQTHRHAHRFDGNLVLFV